MTEAELYDLRERAAIREFDGGMTPDAAMEAAKRELAPAQGDLGLESDDRREI
tara:strand:+ start:3856 stop:4014 length:159 start_codon:yes stop_codon:yes gene_type:complete